MASKTSIKAAKVAKVAAEPRNKEPAEPRNKEPAEPRNKEPAEPRNKEPAEPRNKEPAEPRNKEPAEPRNKEPAKPRKTTPKPPAKSSAGSSAKPTLLSGGNPQIAKAYGDAPVQAYIAAMPGWKRDVGRRLDAVITRTVPGVAKAVKWNSPFYGIEDGVWFLSFHCFAKYVKVAFFRGASLRPVPPRASKQKQVRYLDIHEHDPLDEAQLAAWVKQAAALPGERM